MDFVEVVETRHSIRDYLPEPIPESDIREIVRLGTLAPNAGNNQDWRCVAVTRPDLRDRMTRIVQDKLVLLATRAGKENPERYRDRKTSILFGKAPLVLAVFAKPYRSKVDELLNLAGYAEAEADLLRMRPDIQTASAMIQTMLLAARSLGYGGCWMVGPNVARREIAEALEIRPPWSLVALVPMGRPAIASGKKHRKPLEEVLEIRA